MAKSQTPWGIASWFKSDRVTLSDIGKDSPIALVHQYWASLMEDGRLPARQQIDPLDLPKRTLPWLFIVEVTQREPVLDYRYRLVGTGNTLLVGRDATGFLASEIFTARDTEVVPLTFDETVRAGEPTYWWATVPNDRVGSVEIVRGLFPLAEDGIEVDGILGVALPVGETSD